MTRGGVAGSALGTIVLGAILLRTAVPPSVSPAAPTGAPPKASLKLTAGATKVNNKGNRLGEDGPWKASQEHFAGMFPGGGCPPSATGGANQKPVASLSSGTLLLQQDQQTTAISDPREQLWCIPEDEPVRAMIAIAPDPAHTHLALVFDRTVEAIQLAAGSANYVVDRYWLPWDIELKADWADYDSVQKATKDQKQKETEPGLLLFRWNGDQEATKLTNAPVLYVFLVGDTSTAGINGEQFSRAVDYVQQVCAEAGGRAAGCTSSAPIQIMGPTFSGSLDSLRRLTRAKRSQTFAAYSGTVSSSAAIGNQHLPFKFQSLVRDTEFAVRKFIDLLRDNGDIKCDGRPEVAILSEAATTYGEATRRNPCYTGFTYPREIASLRNAYQAAGTQGVAPASGAGAAARPYLALNLADQTNRSDEPPDFSNPQGPLSKEAVLMNYAAEMRRDHYRYVGISATNVLDALFLSNFLRTAVPDARLFIFNSDLLFERELDNTPYVGTLAITTYPLFPRDWDWTGSGGRPPRLPFADQYEQGQYNASVLTIHEALGRQPEDRGVLYGCTPPCSQAQLPLFLAAVGTAGYWPVQMLAPDLAAAPDPKEVAHPARDPKVLRNEDFPPAWKAACALLCMLALLQVLVLLTTSPISPHFREFAFSGALPEQKLFFINAASASLALGLAMTAMPSFVGSSAGGIIRAIAVLTAVTIILLFSSCISLHICLVLRSKREREKTKENRPLGRPILVSVCVWTAALVLSGFWWTLFKSDPTAYGFFFTYRAVHLATGVSPVTPMLLLLAVIYLWSVFEVWRLRFNEQSRPRLNTKAPFPGALNAGRSTERDAAAAVYRFRLKNSYLTGFIVTYVLWFLALEPQHPFQLFERPSFGRIYEVLLCIVVLMILSKGFRLGQIWSELRKLLFELERSPIRLAFSRLKGFSWSPIWRQGGEEAEWVFMARSFEALRHLGDCDSNLPWTLEPLERSPDPKLREVHEELEAVLTELKAGGDRLTLQSRLAGIRLAVEDIGKKPNADVCSQSRFQAIQRELAAVAGTLDLPDAKASTEAEAKNVMKVVEQMSRPGVSFSLFKTISRYRRSTGRVVSRAPEDEDFPEFETPLAALQKCLANALNYTLDILHFHWNKPGADGVETEEPEKDGQVVVHCHAEEEAAPGTRQVRLLEEYAALRYVSFIRAVLAHLRHSLIFLAISFTLVLLSLNVYSFEPHQSLIWSFTAIFVVIGAIIVMVLMQVHRDHILSRITGTRPNELGVAFYARIFSLGAVPLLTLLATHFPSIGRSLISFLQPGLEALK